MGRINRTIHIAAKVPTSSMADIAFLLLIFFMVTTIFKMEEGLPVTLPRAEAGDRVPRQQISHIWVMSAQEITIEDHLITMVDIVPILAGKLSEDPTLVVGLNVDQRCSWEVAAEVIEMMKEAHALNANFTTEPER